ncbi:MAG: DUF2283 domain-containing protein [Phycisphaerales bacterium]|nr:DUF2283 domain-containing protein [Phycisphaerales bacterium]
MPPESVKIWVDAEGDFVEVTFRDAPGYFRETSDARVMEKVDEEGRILGFSILHVSSLRSRTPFKVSLR